MINTMITKQCLLTRGFTKYKNNEGSWADEFYKLCVRNSSKNLFFIDMKYYRNVSQPWAPSARMYRSSDCSFTVSFVVENSWTIDRLIAEFTLAYTLMQCVPDIHNND